VRRRSWSVEAFREILPSKMITEVVQECGAAGKRSRRLPPELMVWLLVGAGLFRDLSLPNVLEVVADAVGFKPWGPAERPHSTSITQARDRLGPDVMPRLFERHAVSLRMRFNDLVTEHCRPTFTLDGTTSIVPDTPENDLHFGRPGAAKDGQSAFPQVRFVLVVSAWTHLVANAVVGPYTTSEPRLADVLLKQIPAGSLLLLDRAYYGFLWPAQMRKHGHDFVVRMKCGEHTYQPTRIRKLGRGDWFVELRRPERVRNDPGDLPPVVPARMIKCRRRGLRPVWIITSLLSVEEFPRDKIEALYRDRWEGELAYRELKESLASAVVKFRSKTPERVRQEFYGLLIAYNNVRGLMCEAASEADLRPIRLSFVNSLVLIRRAVDSGLRERQNLTTAMSYRRLPPRRVGRSYVRAVKRKMTSSFPKKTRDHRRMSASPHVRRARERALRQGSRT
jgi:hypothetical protein